MADTFTLKVLSPQGSTIQSQVSRVTFPTANGEVTILPRHANYIALLGVGILEYEDSGTSEVKRLLIRQGLCSYTNENLEILADAIYMPDAKISEDNPAHREELRKFIATADVTHPDRGLALDQIATLEALDRLQSLPAGKH